MLPTFPRAGALPGFLAVAALLVAAPALAQTGAGGGTGEAVAPEGPPAVESAPFSQEDAARRFAPAADLDWRTLEDLDAQTYVDRLANLDAFVMRASELVLSRDPRERTTNVARDILAAHEAGRGVAAQTLPESAAAGLLTREDADILAALEDETRAIVFEEAYIDAMIEAHREAIALTSFYRRFGSEDDVREFARLVLPMLEASLYQAVTIRQELVAEFIAARGGGEER
ncbi:DUF4142 domain-containing protein [Salinarimonas ramus]|uniref:DUF4142 domain-containing protein n=1 Tax=Salinarimonas ramus TaxID=690164 RepID=A0A917Q884_9HYPH|nr:DUF4142 domain-containing protein [Salinarimonas ramus]GGK34763.1 hypothetical protein GCM10011322_21890 [Salinarimonas ramus]